MTDTHVLATTRTLWPSLAARLRGGLCTLRLWFAITGERTALARLDDAALADLGLTRADVAHEAARPPWDVPQHRL